jgi:hypothetical protein
MREVFIDDACAAEKNKLTLEFSDFEIESCRICTRHQNYGRQIYDAALNNFARLSISAALASPIKK